MPNRPRKLLTLALICKAPNILLGMKKRGFGAGRWNGFGGKLMDGESIEDATRREIKEEVGLEVGEIFEQGVLDFEFQGKDEILEVHVFKVLEFIGEPTETEEMKPQWFNVREIPFKDMWSDDIYWMPIFLKGKKFTGRFLFNENDAILEHEVKVI
jgi:8-oxo-dGTP diphosphatase/2-hydroxy-dATP diphosphatase